MAYQTCYKVVPTSLTQSWYNKNVTRLTAQCCNNIVISWLYQTCWNSFATSLIMSTRLLQVINSFFQTCWQLGISNSLTACWQTCYKIWDFYACKTKLCYRAAEVKGAMGITLAMRILFLFILHFFFVQAITINLYYPQGCRNHGCCGCKCTPCLLHFQLCGCSAGAN
jgi:hypothetical protein